jgi:hypothetical protein
MPNELLFASKFELQLTSHAPPHHPPTATHNFKTSAQMRPSKYKIQPRSSNFFCGPFRRFSSHHILFTYGRSVSTLPPATFTSRARHSVGTSVAVNFLYPQQHNVERDSSVGMVTRYGMNGPRIESRWGRDFPYRGLTSLLYNGYRGFFSGAWC